ncbi:MAG TPA: hypothetical protein PLF81_25665, partial [Candidatus Anammoximicrobium sp.]|nr:hypothetical protein [Candidatus Anammoximicrobium sp.]
FSAPQAVRSDKAAMWILDGRWKPDRLAELQPDLEAKTLSGNASDLTRLPAHLPTEVRVVLGQSDLLPYRIEYRRQAAESAADKKPAALPIVVLEMVDVRQQGELDERLFVYQPGNQEFADYTDLYLDSLMLERQRQGKPD